MDSALEKPAVTQFDFSDITTQNLPNPGIDLPGWKSYLSGLQPQQFTVLIVDDSSINLRLIASYLKGYGFTTLIAQDGESALKRAEYARPDIILLDVMMPKMDGFEVCYRLKASEKTQHIPVIFMTALTETQHKVRGFQVGGVDYIIKPFNHEDVLIRVMTHLHIKSLAQSLQSQNEQLQKTATALQQANMELEKRAEELEQQKNQLEQQAIELLKAKETAEASHRVKSAFLGKMGHELRTPLNGILGYVQILKRDKNISVLQADGLHIIQQSGEHLLTLINDILDMSYLETRKLEILPNHFSLANFLHGIVGIMRLRAEQKGLSFHYRLLTLLPQTILADESRLRQVLINLLDNAIKFTSDGGVTLTVMVINPFVGERNNQMKAQIRFEIMDTGVGMTPEYLTKIFRPFEQANDNQGWAEGAGLGLSISQQLVQLMGAQLQVKSDYEHGSTFWFDLDVPISLDQTELDEKQKGTIIGYKGPLRQVLVVDDKPYNRLVLTIFFEALGFKVVEAANGQVGVAQAKAIHPDVILLDLVMPVMTGFEAVKQIRQIPELAEVLVIALSASIFDLEGGESLLAGCNAFLSKPVSMKKLLDLLQTYLDLEWVYDKEADLPSEVVLIGNDLESNNEAAAVFIPPPPEEMVILFDLAMRGNMPEIQKRAGQISQLDPKFKPFAAKLQQLAKNFEEDQILNLVEQFL